MHHLVQQAISNYGLANSGTPILVACSGGIDSMVLCTILLNNKYKLGIAHVNFQLRGDESNEDELFVEQFAKEHNIPFFTTKMETQAYKKNNALSTQMAARELRYEWLEKIRKENGYHSIATAHHLDDNIETLLLNMSKGAGIKGLRGMLPKNGFLFRPLLGISKTQLLQYAQENAIAYREDSSNKSDSYQRNKLRHHVVPVLKELNPNLESNFVEFFKNMLDYEVLTQEYIQQLKQKCWSEKNGIVEIKTGFIKSHFSGKTILFHLLADYGFNADQIALVYAHVKDRNALSGKQFLTDNFRLVHDRNSLFLTPKNIEREAFLMLNKIPNQIHFNSYKIECSIVPINELNMKASPNYAYVDFDKLEMPMLIRYAKTGDYFYPFGMGKSKSPDKVGKKKLSKYFKDEKFSLIEKENTPVLFSGERLLWLVGHRIDDRFKVGEKTKLVLKMHIIKQ